MEEADSIGGIATARLTNEEAYLFQRFIRAVIGTNNVDHSGGYAHKGLEVMGKTLGTLGSTNSIADIGKADTILLVRSNLTETHPVVGMRVNMAVKRNKAKLIVANPRTRQVQAFGQRLPQPFHWDGGGAPEWGDRPHPEGGAGGSGVSGPVYRRTGRAFQIGCPLTPKWVEKVTGIKPDALLKAARTFAAGKRAVIIISAGLGQTVEERGDSTGCC